MLEGRSKKVDDKMGVFAKQSSCTGLKGDYSFLCPRLYYNSKFKIMSFGKKRIDEYNKEVSEENKGEVKEIKYFVGLIKIALKTRDFQEI